MTPIRPRTAVGLARDVEPGDADLAGVGREERREDVDVVVLPAPFGPSSAKTVPSGDVEVDAVEHDLLAVRLAEAADPDRRGRR